MQSYQRLSVAAFEKKARNALLGAKLEATLAPKRPCCYFILQGHGWGCRKKENWFSRKNKKDLRHENKKILNMKRFFCVIVAIFGLLAFTYGNNTEDNPNKRNVTNSRIRGGGSVARGLSSSLCPNTTSRGCEFDKPFLACAKHLSKGGKYHYHQKCLGASDLNGIKIGDK